MRAHQLSYGCCSCRICLTHRCLIYKHVSCISSLRTHTSKCSRTISLLFTWLTSLNSIPQLLAFVIFQLSLFQQVSCPGQTAVFLSSFAIIQVCLHIFIYNTSLQLFQPDDAVAVHASISNEIDVHKLMRFKKNWRDFLTSGHVEISGGWLPWTGHGSSILLLPYFILCFSPCVSDKC